MREQYWWTSSEVRPHVRRACGGFFLGGDLNASTSSVRYTWMRSGRSPFHRCLSLGASPLSGESPRLGLRRTSVSLGCVAPATQMDCSRPPAFAPSGFVAMSPYARMYRLRVALSPILPLLFSLSFATKSLSIHNPPGLFLRRALRLCPPGSVLSLKWYSSVLHYLEFNLNFTGNVLNWVFF